MSATHPVRAKLQENILELLLDGRSPDPQHEAFSQALFVQQRLLEFPFESYPDYCYPTQLVTWPHIRWDHVDQTIRFCEHLRQPKGSNAGKPVRLIGFQVLIIHCVLGPYDPETNTRIVRDAVMTISRKNGKSSLVAMMFLAMLSLGCFHLRAQDIQVGASDREQAGILFDLMHNLVLMDEDMRLESVFHAVPSSKLLTHRKTYSKIKTLSSDAYRAHGANPCAVLLDEFGNLPDSKARDFYSVLSTAFGSQLEPLLLMFSTQAPVDSHIFSEFVDRAAQANRDQKDDSGLVGFIFDLPKEDDGTGLVLIDQKDKGIVNTEVDAFAEKNWVRSNPALEGYVEGGFRSLSDLRRKAAEAAKLPSVENTFRNLQLNQRVTAHSPFVSQSAWVRCVIHEPIAEEFLEVAELVAGIDLSTTTDLSAVAFVWRLESGKFYTRVKFYLPENGILERAGVDKVPYQTWADQKFITLTPGSTIDYGFIARDLADAASDYVLEGVAFDRYRFELIRKECLAIDFDPYEIEEGDFWRKVGQGFIGMSPCVTALERLILDGRILIEPNPVLTWNASNTVVVQDAAENKKFDKIRSYGRIDGIVALAMAVYIAGEDDLTERSGEEESVYEGDDLLIL